MDIKLEKYYNIRSVKKAWQELYAGNPKLTPFQDYAYVKHYCSLLPNKRARYQVFYLLSRNDGQGYKPIMICPLSTSLIFRNSRGYELLGGREADISDFIYSNNLTREELKDCLKRLLGALNRPLRLRRLAGHSKILEAMKELFPKLEMKEQTFLKIPQQKDIDEYIAGLSKSTRQNIRTAYNRMNRDEIKFDLEVAYPTKDKLELYNEAISAYVERQKKFYNKKYLLGSKALTELYYKTFDPESRSLKDLANSFTAVLKLNGQVAGIMMALAHENTIVVPRLAIDSEFNFYSPGVILIVETLRYMLAHTQLNSIDLSLGNERYKYSMGGEEYFAYDFQIS